MAVNVNNLDQTIAVYRASLITLRDDHTRLGQLICGDSLTTVMGPATIAGVKEITLIVAKPRANAVLQAMTQDSNAVLQARAALRVARQGDPRNLARRCHGGCEKGDRRRHQG
jgi:hypothetical protein